MALKDQMVNLVIRGKNLFSGTATEAEDSLESLQNQTRELKAELDKLENTQKLVKGFGDQKRAVEAAEQAYVDGTQAVGDLARALKASEGAGEGLNRQFEQASAAATQAAAAIKDQRQQLSDAAKAQKAAERELKKLNTAYEKGQLDAGQYGQALEQAEKQVADTRQAHDQHRQALEQSTQANQAARAEVKRLGSEITGNQRHTRELARQFDSAKTAAAGAKTEYQRQREALEQSRRTITELGGSTTRLNDTQRAFADRQQQLAQQLKQTNAAAAEQAAGLRRTGDAADQANSRLGKLGTTLLSGATSFAKWGAAATAAGASLAVGLLTRYTSEQAALATQLENTAQAIGVNTQTLQEYQRAFETVGIGADKTADILKDVADKIGDAYVNGGGEAKEALANLGLAVEDLINLSPDQQLLAIANALNKLPKAGQVQVLEAIANDASLLQPLLENNAAGLRRLAAEARAVGAIMEPEQIERLRQTDAAITRIQNRLQGLRNKLLGEVSPAVTQLADEFEGLLADNPGLVDDLATAFGGLMRTTADWARSMAENRQQIGEGLQALADTAQFLGNSFLGVFRATQTAAAGLVTIVAGAVTKVHQLVETVATGMNWIGLVSDETLAKIIARAEAAAAVTRDLARQTADYGRQTVEAGAAAVNAFNNTATASEASAQRQQQAQAGVAQAHRDAATAAEDQAARTAAATQQEQNTLVAHFEKLIRHGASAKTAIAGVFALADVSTEAGLTQLGVALVGLGQQGKITAEELRASLGAELAKLSNDDLAHFQQTAATAFAEGSAQALALADTLEGRTAAAFKALGVDVAEVDTGIDSAMQNMLNSLEWVAVQSENSGERIKAAFDRAFDQADSIEELEALRRILERAGEEGRLTGDRLTNALSAVDRKISEVRRNAAGLGDNFSEVEGQGSPAVRRLKAEIERLRAEIDRLRGDLRGAAKEAGELDSAVKSAGSGGGGGGGAQKKGPIVVQTYSSQIDRNRIRGDAAAIEKELLNVQAELDKELAYINNTPLNLQRNIWLKEMSDMRLEQIQAAERELKAMQRQASGLERQRGIGQQREQRSASRQSPVSAQAPAPGISRQPEPARGQQVTVNFQLGGTAVASGQFAPDAAEALLKQLSNHASISR